MSQAPAAQTPVSPNTNPEIPAPPPALVITRTFAVPRDRVFRAWTKADQLARWFSPSDEYSVKAEIDLRIGGAYRIEMHHSGGNVNVVIGT